MDAQTDLLPTVAMIIKINAYFAKLNVQTARESFPSSKIYKKLIYILLII